jgi:predicted transcriptional regulator
MPNKIVLPRYQEVTSEIRRRRDELVITQEQIAEWADADPSHVSRVLNDEREASYEKIYAMWSSLKQEQAEESVIATDLMNEEIEWAESGDTVGSVADTAMDKEYTQLPVKDKGEHIGWVTTGRLAEGESDDSIKPLIEWDGFGDVQPYLDIETVHGYLNGPYRALMVRDGSEYLGIITPYDLMEYALGKETN